MWQRVILIGASQKETQKKKKLWKLPNIEILM
jgi:hypothetical protein